MFVSNVITDGIITNYTLYDKVVMATDIILKSDDKLKNNYSPESLDLTNHKSFDVLLTNDNEVVCFSGLYHRSSWPEGFYRISNRTYVMPNFRTNTYNFLNPSNIGPYQINKHQSDIRTAFISRENAKGKYYFRKLKQHVGFYSDWIISEKMVKLVNDNKKTSYQYVIYNHYNSSSIDQFDSITESEWNELPH